MQFERLTLLKRHRKMALHIQWIETKLMEQNKEEFVNTNGLNLWGTSLVYDERIQGNSARLELNGVERLLLYEQYIGKPKWWHAERLNWKPRTYPKHRPRQINMHWALWIAAWNFLSPKDWHLVRTISSSGPATLALEGSRNESVPKPELIWWHSGWAGCVSVAVRTLQHRGNPEGTNSATGYRSRQQDSQPKQANHGQGGADQIEPSWGEWHLIWFKKRSKRKKKTNR